MSTSVEIRVRYPECDPMGVAHHSSFPVWMEIARTELLRERGMSYRECEAQGVFFVVARMSVRFRRPARYDDVIRVEVRHVPAGGVKLDHEYQIYRGDELLADAVTTLACVDSSGKPRRIPETI